MELTETTYSQLHPNTKRVIPEPFGEDARVFTLRKNGKLVGSAVAEHMGWGWNRRYEVRVAADSADVELYLQDEIKKSLAYLKRAITFTSL